MKLDQTKLLVWLSDGREHSAFDIVRDFGALLTAAEACHVQRSQLMARMARRSAGVPAAREIGRLKVSSVELGEHALGTYTQIARAARVKTLLDRLIALGVVESREDSSGQQHYRLISFYNGMYKQFNICRGWLFSYARPGTVCTTPALTDYWYEHMLTKEQALALAKKGLIGERALLPNSKNAELLEQLHDDSVVRIGVLKYFDKHFRQLTDLSPEHVGKYCHKLTIPKWEGHEQIWRTLDGRVHKTRKSRCNAC